MALGSQYCGISAGRNASNASCVPLWLRNLDKPLIQACLQKLSIQLVVRGNSSSSSRSRYSRLYGTVAVSTRFARVCIWSLVTGPVQALRLGVGRFWGCGARSLP